MASKEDYIISSVAKALKVLKAFQFDGPEFTLTQLSQRCGIGKTSMLRILATLESEGFVKYNAETRKYYLGLILYQLGATAYCLMDIKKLCYPILKKVTLNTRQIVHLAVLAEDEIVVIDRIWPETHIDIAGIVARVGGTTPLHCTGVGGVLAAYSDKDTQERLIAKCDFKKYSERTVTDPDEFRKRLADIRKKGYAINDGEHEPFLFCLTRPIYSSTNKVIAAFSISALRDDMVGNAIEQINQASAEAAEELKNVF